MEEEKTFLDKYLFSNFQTITVANPTKDDFSFQIMVDIGVDRMTGKPRTEPRTYVVKAGGHERFPGVIANMYLDQMSKKVAQENEKEGLNAIVNFVTRAKIYDSLIVEIDDMLNQSYQAFDTPEGVAKPLEDEGKEEAFAGVKSKNAAK